MFELNLGINLINWILVSASMFLIIILHIVGWFIGDEKHRRLQERVESLEGQSKDKQDK